MVEETCECGGLLEFFGKDIGDIKVFRCKRCGKEVYNEYDL